MASPVNSTYGLLGDQSARLLKIPLEGGLWG